MPVDTCLGPASLVFVHVAVARDDQRARVSACRLERKAREDRSDAVRRVDSLLEK